MIPAPPPGSDPGNVDGCGCGTGAGGADGALPALVLAAGMAFLRRRRAA